MTLDGLTSLIAGGENQTLEWKASTGQRSRAMETRGARVQERPRTARTTTRNDDEYESGRAGGVPFVLVLRPRTRTRRVPGPRFEDDDDGRERQRVR
jgi:hypothetical protein